MKGTLYGLAKTPNEINKNELFQSMLTKANGKIFMDGRNLAAGSIFAEQIHAEAITASHLRADIITTDHISAAGISASKIKSGIIQSNKALSQGGSVLNLDNGTFSFAGDAISYDGTNLMMNKGRIQSQDTFSYFDLNNNRFRFGDNQNHIYWNGDKLDIVADSVSIGSTGASVITEDMYNLDGMAVADKTGVLSGMEIFTNKADDDSVVHIEIDGKTILQENSILNLSGLGSYASYNTAPTYNSSTNTVSTTYVGAAMNIFTISAGGFNTAVSGTRYVLSGYMKINGVAVTESQWANRRANTYNTTNYRFSVDNRTGYFEIEEAMNNATWIFHTRLNGLNLNDVITISQLKMVPVLPAPLTPRALHSLNAFDLVSARGRRNYIKNTTNPIPLAVRNEGTSSDNYNYFPFTTTHFVEPLQVGQTYVFSAKIQKKSGTYTGVTIYPYPNGKSSFQKLDEEGRVQYTFTVDHPDTVNLFVYAGAAGATNGNSYVMTEYKLEKADSLDAKATPWNHSIESIEADTIYPDSYKTTISLPVGLRATANAKDRLFRDNDGLWKIERNNAIVTLNPNMPGTELSADSGYSKNGFSCFRLQRKDFPGEIGQSVQILSNRFPTVTQVWSKDEAGVANSDAGGYPNLWIKVPNTIATTIQEFRTWIGTNACQFIHPIPTPVIEVLDQKLQDQLNHVASFGENNSTNVFHRDNSYSITESFTGYRLKLKPYRSYQLTTNIPEGSPGSYSVFFDGQDIVPSHAINGVAEGKPRTITTDDTGMVSVAIRKGEWQNKLESGENWIAIKQTNPSNYTYVRWPGFEGPNLQATFKSKGWYRNFQVQEKVSRTISSVDVFYAESTSATTAPSSGWQTNPPTWRNNYYIWSKTQTVYMNGRTVSTTPVCITGAIGATGGDGAPGSAGRSVSSMQEQYYLSTSKTTQSGGSWLTTQPSWENGKYIWTRIMITYTNPTSTSYTTPVIDASWEAIDGVTIGGVNLLRNSNFSTGSNGSEYWNMNLGAYVTIADGQVTITTGTSGAGVYQANTTEATIQGETYTVSAYVKGTGVIRLGFSGASKDQPVTSADEWKQYSVTVTRTTSGAVIFYSGSNTSSLEIKNVQVERGNKATDWTPAPEDVEKYADDTAKNQIENIQVGGRNLISRRFIEKGKYIEHGNGVVNLAGGHAVTGFIAVTPGKEYILSAPLLVQYRLVFYSSTFSRIDGSLYSGNQGQIKLFTVPSGAFYVRLSGSESTHELTTWMLQEGNKATGHQLAPEDEVVNRNLLLESDQAIESGTYNIKNYRLAEAIPQGSVVTITIWGNLAAAKTRFDVYNSGGNFVIASLKNISTGVYQATANWNVGTSTNTTLNVYTMISTQSGTSRIDKIKVEYGEIGTEHSLAPEDIEARSYLPVRYIRDFINGSTLNTSNHWCEIQAYANGENVAKGKSVYSSPSVISGSTYVTDGYINASYATTGSGSRSYMQVDLGKIYTNVDSIGIWHYYLDGRTYYETKTEVSADGVNWYPIFDSLTEGTYAESESGKIHPNTRARAEALISAYNMSQQLATSTSRVVINGGNITAGTVKSANNHSWINLDNGQFSFGNGNITWNGSNLTVKGNIDAASINTGTLAVSRIPNLDAAKITSGTINAARIAANTITASHIAAGTITATELASNSVTAAKIAAGTITATELASNSVTAIKISANTITGNKIAANTITAGNIAANTITANEMNVNSISSITANLGTVNAGTINAQTGDMSINLNTGTLTTGGIGSGTTVNLSKGIVEQRSVNAQVGGSLFGFKASENGLLIASHNINKGNAPANLENWDNTGIAQHGNLFAISNRHATGRIEAHSNDGFWVQVGSDGPYRTIGEGVVSRGDNANGNFIRFNNGIQMCWAYRNTPGGANNATGNIFVTASANWTFPIAFLSGTEPTVSQNIHSIQGTSWAGLGASGTNNTSTSYVAFSSWSRQPGQVPVSLFAIGRWK